MEFKKRNLVFLVLALVGVAAYVIWADGLENLSAMIRSIHPGWMLLAAGMLVLYWLLEGSILHGVVKALHPAQKFPSSLRTSMIGQLFNCLTPFASGGQPVQAYDMVRTGVPLGIAGSALLIKFILYQVTLTLYSAVILLFYWSVFAARVSGFGWLVFVGFAINFAVMIGLLSLFFFRRFTRRIALALLKLLAKLRIVKDYAAVSDYLEQELSRFHEGFTAIKEHKGVMLWEFFLSVIQLTAFFLIPYFILLAFQIQGLSPLLVVAAQAFVVMISSFVPLPGAAGGAEYSFHTFFAPFFPAGISVNLAMLLWRMITFYLPIVVGMFFFMSSRKQALAKSA